MRDSIIRKVLFVCVLFISTISVAQNVVIVIIDGARYSETFGDTEATYIPNLANLAKQGTLISEFYNDSTTYTSAAIPTIWCGTWTDRIDTVYNGSETQYTTQPSIFEYVRKKMDLPPEKCMYSLKYVPSLWLPSFHKEYGPEFWPYTISDGSDDLDVLNNTIKAINDHKPQFMVVYFAAVDQGGHSGNWSEYVTAIEKADQVVNILWQALQSNSFYKDNTTMIVTNDHGRHNDDNGGFKGHGCGCNGCRHIMFLALGPNIKKNYVSTVYRRLPDVAVTAASVLNLDLEYATGEVAKEIFISSNIEQQQNRAWRIASESILFEVPISGEIQIKVYDINGRLHKNTKHKVANSKRQNWSSGLNPGVYMVSVSINGVRGTQKAIVF